jgi:hypothetical protein
MPNMLDLLAELNRPRVIWLSATVTAVDAAGLMTLSYLGGTISKASHLDSYAPVVGDRVEVLSYEPMGVLVLGKNSAPTTAPAAPVPQTPVIITPSNRATYGPGLTEWVPGVLEQGPDKVACLFYSGGLTSLVGVKLQQVEIELTINSGGPPDFIGHQNDQPTGALVTSGVPFRSEGTTNWLTLPIGIGQALVSGAIRGIGIVSNGQVGSYSGTGRVRLTPLSVTI